MLLPHARVGLSTLFTGVFLVGCSAVAPGSEQRHDSSAAVPDIPVDGALGLGDPYFPELGNGGYQVEHYDLDLQVDLFSEELHATATLSARAESALASFSLDLYGLEVAAVEVDGEPASFERTGAGTRAGKATLDSELVVRPASALASGAAFTVVVRYSGWPEGRYDPSVRFMPVGWIPREESVYVVSECIGASSWFPCNDHPSDKATFSYRVSVEKPYVVAANGVLVEEIDQGQRRTFVWKARDPMATYLATVNLAEFEILSDEGPRGIPIRVYYAKGISEEELAPFRRQAEVLALLESVFGPYPFEAAGGVLAAEQLGGALECQTMPVYGRGSTVEVIVHELAHQWYGDAVSPALWRDMWLNEGFASYSEWLWVEQMEGKEAYDEKALETYRRLRQRSTGAPFDPGVEEVFSGRVYTRGAMVLHGLRLEVGDEPFFRILKSWVVAKGGGNASTAEFVQHASKTAGRDLTKFFDQWLYSPVTPHVEAYGQVDPEPERERRSRRRAAEEPKAEGDG